MPQVADVTGPVGSTVEIAIESQGDVATGEIQFLGTRPVSAAVDPASRRERIWYQERLPDGAGTEGTWDWDFRLLARPAHTEPAARGVHGHRFANAQIPFEVRRGEFLFAYVYIDRKEKPEAIMVSWHDGQDWEHRAYWGDDKFTDGKAGTPGRTRIGPLPPAGQWARLELPAAAVDLGGKTIRGMGFALCGGRCFWHRAGACRRPTSNARSSTCRAPGPWIRPVRITGRVGLRWNKTRSTASSSRMSWAIPASR